MTATLTVKACGGEHTLAFPLGALEDIAKVNPMLEDLAKSFAQGLWKLDEVTTILAAGIKHGKAEITVSDLVGDLGLTECARLAYRCLIVAFTLDDPGNVWSPAETASPSGSASGNT